MQANSTDKPLNPDPVGAWAKAWGVNYLQGPEIDALNSTIQKLADEGKIGKTILDIGSGKNPVSRLIPFHPDRKLITLDLHGKENESAAHLHIRLDAEIIGDQEQQEVRTAIAKVAKFLDIQSEIPCNTQQIDTIILSQILNYVDYKNLLEACKKYLKPGGHIIIMNKPGFGYFSLTKPTGLRFNDDFNVAAKELGYSIEEQKFPYHNHAIDGDHTARAFMIAVLQKPEDSATLATWPSQSIQLGNPA